MAMDVEIAGAGPAGLCAALAGAKKGHKVTVFEKNKTLGKKPCGEATLGAIAGWTPFTKFWRQDFVLTKFDTALVYRDSEYAAEMEIPVDCYMLDKHKFLEEFAEALGGYGVDIKYGGVVTQRYFRQDPPQFMVDATGFIRTSAFAQESTKEIVPVLRVYTKRNGMIADNEILIDVVDGGYFWIFPYGELYNVGFGGEFSGTDVRLKLFEFLKTYDLVAASKVDGAGIASCGPPRKLIHDGVRLAGESAGMVNPGTGEGIRFSMYAGSICLEDDYEERFWKNCGRNLQRSVKLGRALLHLNRLQLAALLEEASPELTIALFDGKIPRFREIFGLLLRNPRLLKQFF